MENRIDLTLAARVRPAWPMERIFDEEKLLRLHPHWHIESFTVSDDRVLANLKDHATEIAFERVFRLSFPAADRMRIDFDNGPVSRLDLVPSEGRFFFVLEPRNAVIPETEQQQLTLWLQSIREYLRLYLKATPNHMMFRFFMNRVMLRMNPSQRKISQMILRFTLLEILVIVLIVVGYVLFVQ